VFGGAVYGCNRECRSLPHFGRVTCHGGNVKSGIYRSLRIAGACTVPTGARVRVVNNVLVKRRAVFNQVTQSTLNVHGNVFVRPRAVIGLGCNNEVGCSLSTSDHIGGNLISYRAKAVVDEQEVIGGSVVITGGGGSMDCSLTALFGGPYFSIIHDSVVGGNVIFRYVHSCWFGLIRTQDGGSVRIVGNRMGDPDAMEIVPKTIGGNLACFNNVPHAQIGDSGGLPNVVGGQKRGECRHL
jgi:hypothetical protein